MAFCGGYACKRKPDRLSCGVSDTINQAINGKHHERQERVSVTRDHMAIAVCGFLQYCRMGRDKRVSSDEFYEFATL